jgi:hypothetical protein
MTAVKPTEGMAMLPRAALLEVAEAEEEVLLVLELPELPSMLVG